MKVKFFVLLLSFFFFLFGSAVFAQSDINSLDRERIVNNLDSLVRAVNSSDVKAVDSLISPNNPILQSEIKERIKGGITYRLDYFPYENNEFINANKVKINGIFSASAPGWSVNGLTTYFVFEKQNDQWLITDTDFHEKLGADYALKSIEKIFAFVAPIFIFVLPIFIFSFVFWLWMLIDCIKRDFDDKALWIILLIFLTFVASILYFFIVKRKNIMRKPLEFKM